MSIRFFEEAVSTDDIPFVKDYLRLSGDINEIHVIKRFMVINKGILCIADKVKGTLWTNSDVYEDFKEAIEISLAMTEDCPCFVFKVTRNGQISVGVDTDEIGSGVIIKTSDNSYDYKLKNEKTTNSVTTNRFLTASQKSLLLASNTRAQATTGEESPTTKTKKSS